MSVKGRKPNSEKAKSEEEAQPSVQKGDQAPHPIIPLLRTCGKGPKPAQGTEGGGGSWRNTRKTKRFHLEQPRIAG